MSSWRARARRNPFSSTVPVAKVYDYILSIHTGPHHLYSSTIYSFAPVLPSPNPSPSLPPAHRLSSPLLCLFVFLLLPFPLSPFFPPPHPLHSAPISNLNSQTSNLHAQTSNTSLSPIPSSPLFHQNHLYPPTSLSVSQAANSP